MYRTEDLEPRRLLSAWYVATTGADSNPGTLAQPFQTIQHAADVAQPGDTVLIRKGTYRETVAPPRSGQAGAPITFASYRNEKATIDGADPVMQWTRSGPGLFQAALSWDLGVGKNQLFQNRTAMTEARWPNTRVGDAGLWSPTFGGASDAMNSNPANGQATATISVPQLTDPAGQWVGATIQIALGQEWVFQTGRVIDSEPGSLTFTYTPLDPYPYQTPTAGDRFYLSGKLQALDAPGEWFLDSSTSMLSFRPSGGEIPKGVEVKHRQYGFDLSGDSFINISGLNFFACTINTDSGSTHNTIDGISARYISQDLQKPNPWADKLSPHASGIVLNGSDNVLQNSMIRGSSGDGVFLGGSNNVVQNCVISDTDYNGADEAGITVMGAGEQVVDNTICNCGRSGIVARFSPAATIAHNRIYSAGLLTTDLGGIYTIDTDGNGTKISYNLISGIHTGGFGGTGIYLDENSSNYIVDHNVVWDVDIAVKMNPPSTDNQISNNTLSGTQQSIAGNGMNGWAGSTLSENILLGVATIATDATASDNLADPSPAIFVNARKGKFQLRRSKATLVGALAVVGAYDLGTSSFVAGSTFRVAR